MEQDPKELEVLVQTCLCALLTFSVHTGTTKSRAPRKNFLKIPHFIMELKRVFVIYKISQFISFQGSIT